MAQQNLAIVAPNLHETFVYCNDTVRMHAFSVYYRDCPDLFYTMKEFSLLDDASIKCRPRLFFSMELDLKCTLQIEFITPVPKANKYEISLYYVDKLGELKFADVSNAKNIKQGDQFSLTCNGTLVGRGKCENNSDGKVIFYSKICRKDTLCVSQKKPAHLHFSQITDCSLLFENTALSNLVISVENREFRVHKEILAAKSSVFLAMFETEMKEKRENHVKIEDIEANIFQEFLRYIYTNTVNDLNIHAEKLYVIADKYDLPKLKLICIDELSRSLNIENAIHMFSFADENNETVLKETTMDFIKKQMTLIFHTAGYKALYQSPKVYLIDEIFRATVDYFNALK